MEARNKNTFLGSDERPPKGGTKEIRSEKYGVECVSVSSDVSVESARIDALSHPRELVVCGYLVTVVERKLDRNPSVKVSRIHGEPVERNSVNV
jgi:hypothetical protein